MTTARSTPLFSKYGGTHSATSPRSCRQWPKARDIAGPMYYYPLTETSDARTGAWVPSKIKSFIADFVRSTVRECVTRALLASEPLITAFAEIIHESERGSCVASNDDASGSAYGV